MAHEHDITFGPFRLEMPHGGLWRGAQIIALRPRSRAMLRYLVEHPGRLMTKAELHQQVWAGTHVTDAVLRVSVREIRAALGDSAVAPRYLETVGRQGYRWLVGGDPELCGRGQAVERRLELLLAEDVAVYVAGRLGGPVAASLTAFIHARTEGHALFLVNILEHLVQQGLVVRRQAQWTLREGADAKVASLPVGLQQFLVRRIEDLPLEARQVLEVASVAGEVFAAAAVAAGLRCPVHDVEAQCERLVAQHHFIDDRGVTVWPDATRGGSYQFQHALYPQVLYEQVEMTRRMHLHRRMGLRLEVSYGARAGEIATQLAVHFERGGETARAIRYGQQVAAQAARRHAHHDATAALTNALALLATEPDTPERIQQEITLQLRLGEVVSAAKGLAAPDVGAIYTRAHGLCEQLGETP
ncbi:MAG: winged helix-turn-helix domain-containing protein [Candidatus Entotheonellia bacterium]